LKKRIDRTRLGNHTESKPAQSGNEEFGLCEGKKRDTVKISCYFKPSPVFDSKERMDKMDINRRDENKKHIGQPVKPEGEGLIGKE